MILSSRAVVLSLLLGVKSWSSSRASCSVPSIVRAFREGRGRCGTEQEGFLRRRAAFVSLSREPAPAPYDLLPAESEDADAMATTYHVAYSAYAASIAVVAVLFHRLVPEPYMASPTSPTSS